jgi:hypothetical protein
MDAQQRKAGHQRGGFVEVLAKRSSVAARSMTKYRKIMAFLGL